MNKNYRGQLACKLPGVASCTVLVPQGGEHSACSKTGTQRDIFWGREEGAESPNKQLTAVTRGHKSGEHRGQQPRTESAANK